MKRGEAPQKSGVCHFFDTLRGTVRTGPFYIPGVYTAASARKS